MADQDHHEVHETYIIPPNFIESGTFMGGMFKVRNTFEAGFIAFAVGFPVFHLPFSLTTKIIVFRLTALPLFLLALIGISGESLSSFILSFFKFLLNRRALHRSDQKADEAEMPAASGRPRRSGRKVKPPRAKKARFEEEFSKEERPRRKGQAEPETHEQDDIPQKAREKLAPALKQKAATLEEYIPIKKIENGIIYTTDGRYVRILEIEPINFPLRSAREQKNIIYAFVSFLKISPVKLQIKVLTRKADINRHLELVRREMQAETDERWSR